MWRNIQFVTVCPDWYNNLDPVQQRFSHLLYTVSGLFQKSRWIISLQKVMQLTFRPLTTVACLELIQK